MADELQLVHIKSLGRPQQLRLMKGGAVRFSAPSSASDAIQMFLLPEHTSKMMKKFKLGKQHQYRLSPVELERNMMEGGSLYSMAKKGLKYASPLLKQAARASILSGSAALAASNPALIPFIPMGAAALGSLSDSAFDDLGNMEVDDAEEGAFSPESVAAYSRHPSVQMAKQAAQSHPSYQRAMENMSQYHPSKYQDELSKYDYGSGNDGFGERAGYEQLSSSIKKASNQANSARQRQTPSLQQAKSYADEYQSDSKASRKSTRGRGLYAGMKGRGMYGMDDYGMGDMIGYGMRGCGLFAGSGMGEKGSVNIAGNIVGHFGVPQAFHSQPFSVNLASRAFNSPIVNSMIK